MAKLTLSSEITDFTIDLHPPIKLDQDKKYGENVAARPSASGHMEMAPPAP